jgi:hypothetical protein
MRKDMIYMIRQSSKVLLLHCNLFLIDLVQLLTLQIKSISPLSINVLALSNALCHYPFNVLLKHLFFIIFRGIPVVSPLL